MPMHFLGAEVTLKLSASKDIEDMLGENETSELGVDQRVLSELDVVVIVASELDIVDEKVPFELDVGVILTSELDMGELITSGIKTVVFSGLEAQPSAVSSQSCPLSQQQSPMSWHISSHEQLDLEAFPHLP